MKVFIIISCLPNKINDFVAQEEVLERKSLVISRDYVDSSGYVLLKIRYIQYFSVLQ